MCSGKQRLKVPPQEKTRIYQAQEHRDDAERQFICQLVLWNYTTEGITAG